MTMKKPLSKIGWRLLRPDWVEEDEVYNQISHGVPGNNRRRAILKRLVQKKNFMMLDSDGCMRSSDKDIQTLIKKGFVALVRGGGIPKWSKEFRELKERAHRGGSYTATNQIRKTYLRITDNGRKYISC